MDLRFLSVGTLLLAFGLFFIYGFFTHPEYFFWAGLGGPLAILSPFIAVFLGAGFIYGSFSKESAPLTVPSSVNVDDWIGEEALNQNQTEDEEIAYCQQNLALGEKLLLIVASRSGSAMNRLALTDRRLLFYPKGDFRSAMSFDYEEVNDARKRQRTILKHLADLTFYARGGTVEFKDVGTEWADEVLQTIKKMKAARQERSPPAFSPSIQQNQIGGFCGNCGNPTEAGSEFCGMCGEKV